MATARRDSLVTRPEDSISLSLGPISARLLMRSDDSEGRVGIVESPIEAGVLASPLHIHTKEDGWWYVLEGTFAAQIGDEVVEAAPGAFVRAPRGIAHTYWNPGPGRARYMEIFSPGGLERYFEQIAHLLAVVPPDIEQILALPAEYGLELLWDSVEELQKQHHVLLPGLPS